jgi:hypothetical protein
VGGEADLLEVVRGLEPRRRHPYLGERRHEQGESEGEDRQHSQQLKQRERGTASHGKPPVGWVERTRETHHKPREE